MKTSRARHILLIALLAILLTACSGESGWQAPGISLNVEPSGESAQVSTGVQLLVLITVLSLAPSILVLATSFTRIVIVLSMVRNAIGTPTIPPNQVVIGLSLLMTFFIMAPVYGEVDKQALQPFLNEEIDQATATEKAAQPLREFMFAQTREKDIQLFMDLSEQEQPQSLQDIPTLALLPAFVISELRTAFIMGFAIYVPFLIIDMVVSSILLAMGMMMLPPSLISLPFKILLFVMVDGWYLITRSLFTSFM
jgi:flagellar biosynthetic protein FliP